MQISTNTYFRDCPSRQSGEKTGADRGVRHLTYASYSQDSSLWFRSRTRLSFNLSARPPNRRHSFPAIFHFIQSRRWPSAAIHTRFPYSERFIDKTIAVLNRRRRTRVVNCRSQTCARFSTFRQKRYHSTRSDERMDCRSSQPSFNICLRHDVRQPSWPTFEIFWSLIQRTRRHTCEEDTESHQIRPLQNHQGDRSSSHRIGEYSIASAAKSPYRNCARLVRLFGSQVANTNRYSGVLA